MGNLQTVLLDWTPILWFDITFQTMLIKARYREEGEKHSFDALNCQPSMPKVNT